MNRDAKKAGFTLIELLIVVAIIAILAAIAVPNFLEAQMRAKVARVKSDLRTVRLAMEAYAIDCNGKYPHLPGNQSAFGATAPGHARAAFGGLPAEHAGGLPDDDLHDRPVLPGTVLEPVRLHQPLEPVGQSADGLFLRQRPADDRGGVEERPAGLVVRLAGAGLHDGAGRAHREQGLDHDELRHTVGRPDGERR